MTTQDDRQAIADLVRLERVHPDRRRWDALADDDVEDSRVETTWFEGTGREFAAASREMAERWRERIHLIAPADNGDRALCESNAQIVDRTVVHGAEVDMVQSCRFLSRVVHTPAGRKLASFDGTYHKDTIAPVNPRLAGEE